MNKDFLSNLLAAPSPSGYEGCASDVFAHYVKPFVRHEFSDNAGNVAFSVGDGQRIVMISAHIDEIALQVQHVDDKGFIHFITDGGIDKKTLPGSTVAIMTDNGIVHGVIGKKPIHIEHRNNETDDVVAVKDLKIDIGSESKEETLKMVNIGDPIKICDIPLNLGEHRFSGRGLDDKTGVAVVAEVLKILSTHNLKNVKVYGVACTQEEVGGTGAILAANHINPSVSIDYDVTFATDDDNVSPNEWGDIKLGKGGCIAHGPDNNRKLISTIKQCCISHDIPYQEFAVKSGMTNTVHIKQTADDCMTALLSIPNRNMHTPVEVCDERDLDSLVNMTVETILAIENCTV